MHNASSCILALSFSPSLSLSPAKEKDNAANRAQAARLGSIFAQITAAKRTRPWESASSSSCSSGNLWQCDDGRLQEADWLLSRLPRRLAGSHEWIRPAAKDDRATVDRGAGTQERRGSWIWGHKIEVEPLLRLSLPRVQCSANPAANTHKHKPRSSL